MDGTFKTCPTIFDQIYTVHVKLRSNKTVPVVYALLPNRSASTYRRLLAIIDAAIDGHAPGVIHLDFELTMIQELQSVFPAAQILGCNFHLNQCIWRHIQRENELCELYKNDDDFNLHFRMFAALAFVPANQVRQVFQSLITSSFIQNNMAILRTFITYFETTWVGTDYRGPRYKIDWWNSFEATLRGMARTNNQTEGWHSAFAGRVGCAHPGFHSFLTHLRAEQSLTEFTVVNSEAQADVAVSRRVYRDRQKRLKSLAESYGDLQSLRYLGIVALNISF